MFDAQQPWPWLCAFAAYALSAVGVALIAHGLTGRRTLSIGIGLLSLLGLFVLAFVLNSFDFDGGEEDEDEGDDQDEDEGDGGGAAGPRGRIFAN